MKKSENTAIHWRLEVHYLVVSVSVGAASPTRGSSPLSLVLSNKHTHINGNKKHKNIKYRLELKSVAACCSCRFPLLSLPSFPVICLLSTLQSRHKVL